MITDPRLQLVKQMHDEGVDFRALNMLKARVIQSLQVVDGEINLRDFFALRSMVFREPMSPGLEESFYACLKVRSTISHVI